jgi:hypothetical protein
MKSLFLTSIILLKAASSFASPIEQAIINGDWNNSSTWNLNRVPQNGDSVVIPGNKTVTITSNLFLNSDNIKIAIYGKLSFVGGGSKLNLAGNSGITVYPAGLIIADGNGSSQWIQIGSNTVFTASDNTVTGPQLANSTTIGFVPFVIGVVTLPVKFESFMLSLEVSDVLVQWSTAQEINSATYEVEKSLDAKNWNTIAYILAAVNSSSVSNYSYKDKEVSGSVIYYRIKEVDQNGTVTYTSIRSIRTETAVFNSNIKIANSQHTVFIQFQQEVKGNVMVRLISLSGQIITQQVVNQPVGQLTLNANSNLKGNYIISISNGQDVSVAKQIIL